MRKSEQPNILFLPLQVLIIFLIQNLEHIPDEETALQNNSRDRDLDKNRSRRTEEPQHEHDRPNHASRENIKQKVIHLQHLVDLSKSEMIQLADPS